MNPAFSFQRTFSVARKEFLHIIRDPATLFFALFIPVLELFMLGYAIDTNVRHVRTVIADFAGTQESRILLQRFENSQDFKIVARVLSEKEMGRLIVAGKARVGIIIQRKSRLSRKRVNRRGASMKSRALRVGGVSTTTSSKPPSSCSS